MRSWRRRLAWLLLVALLGGCSQNAAAVEVPADFELVQGDGYSFVKPVAWLPLEEGLRNSAREEELVAPVDQSVNGVRGTLFLARLESSAPDAEAAAEIVEAALLLGPGEERVSQQAMDVPGADSAVLVEFVFRSPVDGETTMRQYDLVAMKGMTFVDLAYGEPDEVFDEQRARTVIESLRLDG